MTLTGRLLGPVILDRAFLLAWQVARITEGAHAI
jgi:hypothetical protein